MFRFYSAWVGIAIRTFSNVVWLSSFVGSLRDYAFLYENPDKKRSRRRGVSTFLRKHIGLAMLSAGSPLGLKCGSRTAAAPDCAKKPLALWTLFI